MASNILKSRITSLKFALNGIFHFFNSQVNARIQLAVTFMVIITGILLKLSQMEWIAISLCIAMVLGAELINTSIEALANAVDRKPNPQIGLAKDLAAGAVLIVASGAAAVGAFIFIPKFLNLC